MKRDPYKGLPPFARQYLDEARSGHRVVRAFHRWIQRTGRAILQLEPRDIDLVGLTLPTRKPSQARAVRRSLFRYLRWLHERRLLALDPLLLWPRGAELPSLVVRFTTGLQPTHRPATISGYKTALRHFHVWLDSHSLTVDTLDRPRAAAWLQWLADRELSACHRVHTIGCVRMYFRWLEEQPEYRGIRSDDLFRGSDLPKLPQYLPRPVPNDLDRVIQRRLRKARDLTAFGLLLMRRTGLRIGELRALPLHCVHVDDQGRQFLKVPLGKLNSERLVPIDRRTFRVLDNIRVAGSLGKRGLRRSLLFQRPDGKPIPYPDFCLALRKACRGLVFDQPMTSHRLRHTYATSMLSAGVSIPVLMKLLGHRSYRMTLRYAAVTLETVTAEYVEAVANIEQRYDLRHPTTASDASDASPEKSLADLARYLLKTVEDAGLDKNEARSVVRRLHRLNRVVQRLLRDCARVSTRPE